MALSSTLRKSGWRVSIAGERRRRADRLNIPSGQISRETAQRWIPGRQGRQYHQGQRGRSSWTCACVCRVSQTEFTFVSQARVCLHTRRKPDATEKTNPACFSVGLLKRKKMFEEGDGCGRREVGRKRMRLGQNSSWRGKCDRAPVLFWWGHWGSSCALPAPCVVASVPSQEWWGPRWNAAAASPLHRFSTTT